MTDNKLTTEEIAGTRTTGSDEDGRPEPDAAEVDREAPESAHEPLLPTEDGDRFKSRWHEIQAGFVDEPQHSVEQADALVAELMQRLAATFSDERGRLEAQWAKGGDVSTEDLRVALTRYRSFFDRLLSA
jgi:hypothetical protein